MHRSGANAEPDFAMALSKIQHMSKEELNDLLNNEAKLEEYVKSLDQITNLYNEKDELMVANKSLAEYNLSQEPVLIAKRQQLTAKHQEAIQLVSAVKEIKSELEQKSGKIQPDSLYYLLEVDASKAETESDDIANDYLDKKIESTDEFLEKFVALRKIMYLRRVKLDKLKELIRNPTRTPVRKAPDAPPPAAAMYTPPSFGGAPYPTSGPAVPAPVNNWDQQTGSNANLPYPLNPTMAMPSPAYR